MNLLNYRDGDWGHTQRRVPFNMINIARRSLNTLWTKELTHLSTGCSITIILVCLFNDIRKAIDFVGNLGCNMCYKLKEVCALYS